MARSWTSTAAIGLALFCGDVATPQGTPICGPFPHDGNPPVRYLSGGTPRRIHTHTQLGSDPKVWVAEDGGRIRMTDDGGANWKFQQTPFESAGMLLDVDFKSDGTTGYACGRGGWVLKTLNGGDTWQLANTTPEIAKDGNPGVFWGVHFFESNPNIGLRNGLWDFKYTLNGGSSWADVELYESGFASLLDSMDFEFYTLEVRGTLGGGWIGIAGANWETNTPDVTGPNGPEPAKWGTLFYTNSTVPAYGGGRKWEMVHVIPDHDPFDPNADLILNEPWDLDVRDEGPGAVWYMVGGVGHGAGSIWTSIDEGQTWQQELGQSQSGGALYGVTTLGGGTALAVGYGGQVWIRNPGQGGAATWTATQVSGYTAPLTDVQGIPGTSEAWACGSFGFLRHTFDGGANWTTENHGETLIRPRDIDFADRNHAVMVGQLGKILFTTDGGCSFADSAVSGAAADAIFNGVDMKDTSVGMVVGRDQNAVALVTTDGGVSFAPPTPQGAALGANWVLNDVHYVGSDSYWVAGVAAGKALVAKTDDAGGSWTRVDDTTISGTLSSITFLKPTEAFAVGRVGTSPLAIRITNATSSTPTLTPLSAPLNASPCVGAMNQVTAGVLNGSREVYMVGDNGTLWHWNKSAGLLETVPGLTPCPGAPCVCHDFTAIGIDPAHNHLLVGSTYDDDLAISGSVGYLWRYDGSWTQIKSQSNHDAQAIRFVPSSEGYVGFVVSRQGPYTDPHGTIADGDLVIYYPTVGQ